MEENRKLKVAAAKYNWDLEQGQSLETITDAREFFFPKSGPFILNDKLERIEDSITEYKHHPIIYSKYGDEKYSFDHKFKGTTLPTTKEVLEKNIVAFLNTNEVDYFLV